MSFFLEKIIGEKKNIEISKMKEKKIIFSLIIKFLLMSFKNKKINVKI
jgi:hypothetical protein